jgi:predicted HAD superfamily phosphohydrolase YqeG
MNPVALSSVEVPLGATVILDIDGTVIAPGNPVIAPEEREAVLRMAQGATVVLLSNKKEHARNQRIAEELGVAYHRTGWKKPFPRSAQPFLRGHPLVVVGDKFLTDGLLALFIRASFIKVRRLSSREDSFFDRLACAIDDGAYMLLKPLLPRHER